MTDSGLAKFRMKRKTHNNKAQYTCRSRQASRQAGFEVGMIGGMLRFLKTKIIIQSNVVNLSFDVVR